MKKLLIVLLSLTMAFTVSAQRHFHSHVVVVGGYAPYYPYGYGFGFGYGYPYYPYYGYPSRPTKLDLQIEDIKNDYQDRIWGAKHDNSLSPKERRQEVRQLKHDRDQAIIDAKRNYYKRN
jgi:hypothetical protein